jgi:hypothetical protein
MLCSLYVHNEWHRSLPGGPRTKSALFLHSPPTQNISHHARSGCVTVNRVESHKPCQVKSLDAARFIFVSQTRVIGRDGCCLEEEIDVEKLILLLFYSVLLSFYSVLLF